MTFEFIEIARIEEDPFHPPSDNFEETQIVRELTEKLFDDGWRIKRYLKNSEVDYVKFLEQEEERELLALKESVDPPLVNNESTFIEESDDGSRWVSKPEIY